MADIQLPHQLRLGLRTKVAMDSGLDLIKMLNDLFQVV